MEIAAIFLENDYFSIFEKPIKNTDQNRTAVWLQAQLCVAFDLNIDDFLDCSFKSNPVCQNYSDATFDVFFLNASFEHNFLKRFFFEQKMNAGLQKDHQWVSSTFMLETWIASIDFLKNPPPLPSRWPIFFDYFLRKRSKTVF